MAQEEDDDLAFTQPSTSQVQRGLEKLTTAQVDQKVRDAHRHPQCVTFKTEPSKNYLFSRLADS